MVKKDKKSKVADKKARVAAKTSKKTAQKTKKNAKKKTGSDSESDDQDIDAILEEYERKQAAHMQVHEAVVDEPPPVRSNSLLLPSPSNSKELFLFSGELVTGTPPTAKFFNDLHVYHTERNEWKQITSGNSPLPRSGAAMTMGGQGKAELWMFGGEFSSRNFNIYFHYSDFWRLTTDKREWEKVDVRGTPSGRSGHRMTYWKNYIILFGGFQATSPTTTKYLNDLHLFNTTTHTWQSIPPPASHIPYPAARSSFSFLPHEEGAVIYGGYSRVKATTSSAGAATGRKQKSSMKVVKDMPVVHTDTWLLKINPNDLSQSRWERRKKPGNLPNPPRVGVTMAFHRGRGVMFGGVHDVEDSDETLESKFFDEMWVWGIVQNRFWETKMRKLRKQNPNAGGGGERGQVMSKRDRAKQDEAELLKNLALLEAKHELEPSIVEKTQDTPVAEAPTVIPIEMSLALPSPRFNTALAVQNDVLYIYGGSFEKGDIEFTYDEMYRIDLEKLDGCGKIWSRASAVGGEDEMDEDEDDEEDDEDESDEDEDGDEDMEDEEDEEAKALIGKKKKLEEEGRIKAEQEGRKNKRKPTITEPSTPSAISTETPLEPPTEESTPESTLPMPRPFENLRMFYARTSNEFQRLVMEALKFKSVSVQENTSVKEIRTEAFDMAETRWWEVREEIREKEEELEELGVGEGGSGMIVGAGGNDAQGEKVVRRR